MRRGPLYLGLGVLHRLIRQHVEVFDPTLDDACLRNDFWRGNRRLTHLLRGLPRALGGRFDGVVDVISQALMLRATRLRNHGHLRAAHIGTLRTMEDAPWVRAKAEGLLGQWHMPAGDGVQGLLLCACNRTFNGDTDLEHREVRLVPANERCPVCQGVLAARAQSG